jgi:hypothetical protein
VVFAVDDCAYLEIFESNIAFVEIFAYDYDQDILDDRVFPFKVEADSASEPPAPTPAPVTAPVSVTDPAPTPDVVPATPPTSLTVTSETLPSCLARAQPVAQPTELDP